MYRLLVACILLLALTMSCAQAATIDVKPGVGSSTILSVSGELVRGDDERFATTAADASEDTTVVLTGPGGNLVTGLRIGSAIRMRGWKTAVPNGVTCASACGLVWLGGIQRTVGWQSRVGFHAAWIEGMDGVKRETGSGNALIGSYLSRLGLTDSAVLYLTSAAPDSAAWLTEVTARDVGVRAVFSDQEASQQASGISTPPRPPISAPVQTASGEGIEKLISALYVGYPGSVTVPKEETCVGRACKVRLVDKDAWTSKDGVQHQLIVAVAEVKDDCHACAAILGVGQFRRLAVSDDWQPEAMTPAVARVGGWGVFGGTVRFVDGGALGRVVMLKDGGGGMGENSTYTSLVVAVKFTFKEVLVVPLSMNVDGSCDDKELECKKKIAKYDYDSKLAVSTGDDNMLHIEQTFGAAFPIPTARWIIDEQANVRQTDGGKFGPGSSAQDRASLNSLAFDQGHTDRVAYEAWVAGLGGDARMGADFWASRRSLRAPGHCKPPIGQSTQWSAGCAAARQRLGTFDAKRKSEPDYRKGWNSV